MPIIQISKIQQRSGNLVDLPQLDDAQLGWANDARRLFIGRGDPYDPENVEVLTSYSDISFSQIDGSGGGNFNIQSAQNGQLLTFIASTNTWENYPQASITNPSLGGNASFKLDLGNVENLKITGNASTGFVLETDGLGNLSWTPKGVVVSAIQNVTKANPGVVTTVDNHYLVEGAAVTITDVNGMTQLNGNVYYANVLTSNTFILCASPGPSSPVDTSGFGTYTGNGQIVSTVGGSVSTPGGSANSIQFNNSGYLDGSPYLTITPTGNLTHSGPWFTATGNVTVGNLSTAGTVTATGNGAFGNLSTGGLITATGNITGANIVTAGRVTATGNLNAGNVITAGIMSSTGNATHGNISTSGLITATGNIRGGNLVTTGAVSATGNLNAGNVITGGIVSATGNGTFGNVLGGNLVSANFITGTLTTAAQPNITSTGTLASVSVSGNANVGNINVTGSIIPTSNVTYDLGNSTNLFRDLYLSGTSIKLGTQTVTSNASGVALSNAVFTTTLSASGNANIGNIGTAGLITATGNIQGGNLVTGGAVSATGNGTFGNVTATTFTGALSGAASTAGTVTTNAQPNITSVGTLTSVSVSGNANIGNIGTGGLITATGNIRGGNLVTGGVVSVTGNANIGNIGTGGLITATGNITGGNITTSGTLSTTTANVSGNLNVNSVLKFPSNSSVITGKFDGGTTAVYFQTDIGSYPGPVFPDSTFIVLKPPTGGIQTGIELQSRTDDGNSAFLYTTVTNSAATLTAFSAGTVANIPIVLQTSGSTRMTIEAAGNVSVNNRLTAGTLQSTALTTGANTTAGTITGNWSLSAGSRLNATYADLAEYYEADARYEPGTVLEFGGEKEVTIATDETTKVAGVVTTNPAYVMNTNCPGIAVAIALQGRVPVKVRGVVKKGDMMVSAGNGFARPTHNPKIGTIIGKALADFNGVEGTIEIAVGRL